MEAARERRLPQLQLTLDVPTCAFRCHTPAPVTATTPSTSSTSAARQGEFRLNDFDRLSVLAEAELGSISWEEEDCVVGFWPGGARPTRTTPQLRLCVLGSGNGGTMYKVSHRRTSALYALKIINRGHAGAADEAEVVVDSPHIVRCHSVLSTASGDAALLLELMDGGSLDSLVGGHGGFPEAALAEVAGQALSGLAYLRARRVVHRDIKPANLLISRTGQVKIADFGIAKVVPRAGNHCAAYEGTAAYMSPERFDTERLHDDAGGRVDPYAADAWSLGVTVLELFMGRYPLLPAGQTPSWAALMCAICFAELPALSDGAASPELRDFVAACLHKDHRKRASVAELLAHPFVAGRDVAASRRSLLEVIDQRCS